MPHTLGGLKPGALVAARYEVLQFVGKGGMGVVLKARDRALDEIVALKVLRADLAESAEMDRRFRTEIKLARRVRHRNVCAIHEYGEDGPLRYISMEFIEGTDLRHIMRETGGPLLREAYEIAEQAAEGLQAIHEAGIIHRDLKTSNIMRDSKGFVRLMDFGIAKDSSGDTGATGTGQLIGTPEYMSPEQIRGGKIDFRSDVYSLGIVIFEVFTGRVPFHADTPIATILKHLQEPAPLDGPEAAQLPPALVQVLARALAKERAARQSNVAELLEELRQARGVSFPESGAPRATGAVTRPIGGRPAQPASSRVTEVPAGTPTLPAAPPTVALRPPPAPVPKRAAATRRLAPPPPASGSALRRALWVGAPILLLAGGGGALLAVRWLGPQPSQNANAAAAPPVPSLPPPGAPPVAAPSASAGPATAAAAPSSAPTRPPRTPPTSAPAVRDGPSGSDLAAIERTAATDPEAALAQAAALAVRYPTDEALRQRVAQYRAALAERLLSRGREALAKAEAAGGLEGYLEANRLFSKSLDVDPGSHGAREGLAQAIRGEERAKARLTQVSFEQTGTEVSGGPSTDLPPGLAAPPSGVVVKRAQPTGPRARIAIEIEPRLLKPGEPYVVRYFLQNESTGTLLLAGASIQNQIGASGVTGGRVEPAIATVAPGARSLLFEARDVWRHELGTAWRTTLRVFLTDGSVFSSSLSANR